MDSTLLVPITQDIIAFLLEASHNNPEFGSVISEVASSDPTGDRLRVNLQHSMIVNDEKHNVPIFHRLVVGKALYLHVDWEEVAAFFNSNNNTEV